MLLYEVIPLKKSPKLARQDFLRQIFARSLKRLGTAGLAVKAHDQEVVGSNPGTVHWMDVSDLLAVTLG
jgi:hypothetical protein